LAVAKLFWLDRKVSKARAWFSRALAAPGGDDLGDAWAWAYRFEQEHGTPEQQAALLARCAEAESAHGERWCAVAKDDRHTRLKAADILKIVVARLPNDVFATLAPQQANA
jgi:pre-mRNA-processing factor 6